jgi:hypothetical protein
VEGGGSVALSETEEADNGASNCSDDVRDGLSLRFMMSCLSRVLSIDFDEDVSGSLRRIWGDGRLAWNA